MRLEPAGASLTSESANGAVNAEAWRRGELAEWHRRRLLERKLHDGAAMRASALVLRLGVLRELVPDGNAPLLEGIDDVQDELHLMLDELREVAAQIYPPLLEEAGLVPALRELVTQLDAPVRVIAGPHAQTRFGDAEPAIYFGLADGLAAAARSGRPVEIVLRPAVSAGGRELLVSVTGVGPEVGEALLDRVQALGGTVEMWRDDGGTGAVRVALAEDGALFREGLQMLLQAAGHEVVAVAAGGDELRELLATTPADVAVLDIRMPPEPDGGLTTAERLREVNPEMGLLFLSHYAESHYLMRILRIGTESIGYRLKEKIGSVEALSDTLARIEAGEIVIEPVLAKRLVDRPGAQRKDAVATLSERELDVLRLMAEGRSNGGIAAQLFVSAKAVEKHIASIFTKLDLHPDASVNHRRVLAVLRYLRSQRDED